MDTDERVHRQATIWKRLYGPARAQALEAELRRRLAEAPGTEFLQVVRSIDPEDATPADELTAARW